MITAVLTAAVVWCLFYGKISLIVLAPFCAGLGTALAILGKHKHPNFLAIDILAQASRLKKVNATLKFFIVIILMMICISARSPVVGIYLAVIMAALVIYVGGLELRDYINILALPVSFLMMSGLVFSLK